MYGSRLTPIPSTRIRLILTIAACIGQSGPVLGAPPSGEPKRSKEILSEGLGAIQEAVEAAQVANEQGRHAEAIVHAKEAIERSRTVPRPFDFATATRSQGQAVLLEGAAHLQIAMASLQLGDLKSSDEAAQAALEKLRAVSSKVTSAGESDETAKAFEKLRKYAEGLQNLALEIVGLLGQSPGPNSLQPSPSNVDTARAAMEARLREAKKTGDRAAQVRVLRAIAATLGDANQSLEALAYLHEARSLIDELEDPIELNLVETNLSITYSRIGDYQHAVLHAKRALEAARRLPHRTGSPRDRRQDKKHWFAEREVLALTNLGLTQLVDRGQSSAGRTYLQQALVVSNEFLDGTKKAAHALTVWSLAETLTGHPDEAVSSLQKALKLQQSHRSPATERVDRYNEASILLMLAENLVSMRQFNKAERYIRQAERLAPKGDFLTDLSVTEARARALLLKGSPREAETLLLANIRRIDDVRRSLSLSEMSQISVVDRYSSNYDLLQAVLLQQQRHLDLLEQVEARRGRTLMERSRSSDTQAGLRVDDIRRLAAERNATFVIYSMVYDPQAHLLPSRVSGTQPDAERSLITWIVRPKGPIVWREQSYGSDRKVGRTSSVLALPARLRGAVRPRGIGRRSRAGASREELRGLYEVLIAPVADLLPPAGEHVVFVPQGPLLMVPFSALIDGAGHALVERHPIVVVPSIKLLARNAPHRNDGVAVGPPLVVGNPNIAERISKTYEIGDLPAAEREAKRVASTLKTKPLLGRAANLARVVERLPGASLIHLATHGILDGRAVNGPPGAVVLAPGVNDSGLLDAQTIMSLSLRAELAVLSACDTGRGQLTGEGVVGLSYAFIRAGVPAVVVSLWSVPDESTAVLMEHFHQLRLKERSPAEALRKAMLATIADGFKDPSHWAAFVFVGQW